MGFDITKFDRAKKIKTQTKALLDNLIENLAAICKDTISQNKEIEFPLKPKSTKKPMLFICDNDGVIIFFWEIPQSEIEKVCKFAQKDITAEPLYFVIMYGKKTSGHLKFPKSSLSEVLKILPLPTYKRE